MRFRTPLSARSLARLWLPDVWALGSALSFIANIPLRHSLRDYECSPKFCEAPATTRQTIPKRTTTRRPRKKPGTNLREQQAGENEKAQTNRSFTWNRTLSRTKAPLHFSQHVFENEKTITDPASVKLADYFPDTATFRYTHARYHDRMAVIDEIVGSTISKLKEDGLLEDTVRLLLR